MSPTWVDQLAVDGSSLEGILVAAELGTWWKSRFFVRPSITLRGLQKAEIETL